MIVTDLGVFRRADHRSPFALIELAPGVRIADVVASTSAAFETALA